MLLMLSKYAGSQTRPLEKDMNLGILGIDRSSHNISRLQGFFIILNGQRPVIYVPLLKQASLQDCPSRLARTVLEERGGH